MARLKQYSETAVIEKATNVFWKNGLEATSMQVLEKEMGINKFSIYASFGSKEGVFIECVRDYAQKIATIQNKLKTSHNGLIGIKEYFYDFIEFSRELDTQKGCLVTNTFGELSESMPPSIVKELKTCVTTMKGLIEANIAQENNDPNYVQAKADYLMIALHGLAAASKVFEKEQLNNYIENIFNDD